MKTVLLALFAVVPFASAVEPWADDKLPMREGLELWLDAARQPAGRTARAIPPLTQTVDTWLDGSGKARDVRQATPGAQPGWHQTPGGAFVRFDGKDDWLGATGLAAKFEDATVFVVTAPRENPGDYRGFVSWTQTGQNDWRSGLNLDLGKQRTSTFSRLNAEGAGFTGETNLLNTQLDFGTFHLFSLVTASGASGTRLYLDGSPEDQRGRSRASMHMDELAIGARLYTTTSAPPSAHSFLSGDIAEVLVFGRALGDPDRAKVEQYLLAKHRVVKVAPRPGTQPLVAVKDPPLAQMLVPGFTARTLPVELTNIDCLRYRADGKLLAGAYNGKIWLLDDTNGDGLEDRAALFWESADLKAVIGMAVTLPNDPRGEGVFVATQGRILFIADKDRDGRGDEQRVIASGWQKQLMGGGGGIVDALGLTMDKEGNLFFGLGVSAFANAYEVDAKTGVAGYQLGSERGTIQRISADLSKRETVCTGIRYPYGAAFNALGDLFVSEQEGATWLPNGNPFDELLHIQPGRHYGFPPRHPKHLPDVIDEPSVFDFAPQHQSTCGLTFNEGPKSFGPPWWKGDALTAGEARGKLYRTKLVKTDAGYVAHNQLIGALGMLAVDVAVSPRGDVLVACHSGGPDWGTGPAGAGTIVSLRHTAPEAAQPVLTWSASPTEWRVAFDRELDPTKLRDFAKGVKMEQGTFVAAGDRFESFRPGYQAVKDQLAAPRFIVPVLSTALSADRRSLIFATPPRTAALSTAITLPDFTATSAAPRHPQIDVAGDLTGVEAEWTGKDGATWRGWLPHPNLAISRALTAASAEHAALFELLAKPGELRLRGQLDLYEMLQPSVQPGAKLDYERPVEQVTVRIESGQSFIAKRGDVPSSSVPNNAQRHCFEMRHSGGPGEWLRFDIALVTGGGEPDLALTWNTADDRRARAFPLRRVLLPWAQAKPEPPAPTTERKIAEIEGGNWLRGQKLYFGKATCGACHKVRGEGGLAGPDLSNLVQRDYASVVRDIREPSATLNPEHLGYAVETKDGGSFAAVLLGGDDREARFADATGVKTIARDTIRTMDALPASLMPPGLLDALNPQEHRDLLTFLLTAMEPAPLEAKNPPPPRPRAEVTAWLKQLAPATAPLTSSKLKIVLCAGPKDHGKGEHDYPLWQKRWSRLLALADGVEVETAWVWPSAGQWQSADVVAFFSNNPGWNPEHAAELDAFLARGKGLAYFHFAIDGHDDGPGLANRIGLAIHKSMCKYRHGPVNFELHQHPLTAGLPPLHLVDESYWSLVGNVDRVKLMASAVEEGASRPQIWTLEEGKGRVFVAIPGHYNWTFDDPLFRAIAFRGICWAAQQPIDRLAELIPIGARIAE